MGLVKHDDYARDRAVRDPEFARLRRNTAIELLDGSEEDRRIATRILKNQLDLSDEEINDLQRKETAA